MKWSKLFTTQRLNDIAPKSTSSDKIRTSFLRDYDRIIFSGAFFLCIIV
jgi:dGTPase